MLLLMVLTSLTLIAVTAYFFWRNRSSRYLQGIGGPPPHIIFGNTLDLKEGRSVLLRILEAYTKEYGSIVKVHDGPFSKALLISDLKFVQYILTSTKMSLKAFQYSFFHKWLGNGLLISTGLKWKKKRRMLTPSFHFSILNNNVSVFESVGDMLVNKLNQHVEEPSFDVSSLVSLCALDIICEAAMGISIDALNDGNLEYVESVKAICQVITDRVCGLTATFQPWIHPFTSNYLKEKKSLKIVHKFSEKVIDNRMKDLERISNNDNDAAGLKKRLTFLDLLLNSTVDGKPLSKLDIRDEVNTFMFGGHDTVSSAITFALYCLSVHPEVQSKAFEEQKLIFGGRKTMKVETNDLIRMKYLELVIKETLRLFPPVPWFGREVAEEFEFEGILYPKGLTLMVNIYGIHRDPKNFPDPEKFIPERFLNADLPHPFAYVPFSGGPRNCLGQKFAMMEMKCLISKVIRHFELHPATPEHKLHLTWEIMLASMSGVNISLKIRK